MVYGVSSDYRTIFLVLQRQLHNAKNTGSYIVSSAESKHIAQNWGPKLASFPSLSPFR